MVDDNKPLPEDIELSKQIVRILLLLQPLKNISNEFGEGRFFVEPKTEIHPDDTALSLMTKPAAALIEDNESVMRTVFKIFAQENDWDYLVVKNERHEPKKLLSIVDQEHMSYQNIKKVRPLTNRLDMIQLLIDRDFSPLFSIDEQSDELGIISIEELILDDGFIPKILERIAKVDEKAGCRRFSEGHLYIKQGKFGPLLVAKANWIDVINKQQEEIQEPLHSLRGGGIFSLIPISLWLERGFTCLDEIRLSQGVKNLETCEAALAEVEKDRTYHAIFGLNEYLRDSRQ